METLSQDIRYSLRMMLKRPGTAFIAVITLVLGIGANTAIFSVVDAILLKPLPYPDPDRLLMVWEWNRASNATNDVSPPNFRDWAAQSRTIEHPAAFAGDTFTLTGESPMRINGLRASWTLFPALGVAPLHGRTFAAQEDDFAAERVTVLSYGLWQSRFGGDPDIIGSPVTLDGRQHTIVGIMPRNFRFPDHNVDLWVPMAFTPREQESRRGHFLQVIGRLKPGFDLLQAQEEMNTIAARLEQTYPGSNTGDGIALRSLHEEMTADSRLMLGILSTVAILILLIACGNVGNLLLAQIRMRRKELAIRTALGAGRNRLMRQLLTESLLLALIGGLGGALVAVWGVDMLMRFLPSETPRFHEVGVDARTLMFTMGVSCLTGLAFGMLPALQAVGPRIQHILREGGRLSTAGMKAGVQRVLTVSQIAMAVILLSGAGLMINSFLRLQKVDPGYETEQVLTMEVTLPQTIYGTLDKRAAFYRSLTERVAALPGVESAGMINFLPLTSSGDIVGISIEGQPDQDFAGDGGGNLPAYRIVSPDYFQTMHIPIIQGRSFSEQGITAQPNTAIIDEATAKIYWPDENPIGKQFRIGLLGQDAPGIEVIGVAGAIRHTALTAASRPVIYVPFTQTHPFWAAPKTLTVRTTIDPSGLVRSVQQEITALDTSIPVSNVQLMRDVMAASIGEQRTGMWLLGGFGMVALILAATGIYGLIAFIVVRRTQEFGVRMALGAQKSRIFGMVIKQGLKVALIGLGTGLAGAVLLTRFLENLLYEVQADDPATLAAVMALLVVMTLLACYIPARRAMRVDPIIAIRED